MEINKEERLKYAGDLKQLKLTIEDMELMSLFCYTLYSVKDYESKKGHLPIQDQIEDLTIKHSIIKVLYIGMKKIRERGGASILDLDKKTERSFKRISTYLNKIDPQ